MKDFKLFFRLSAFALAIVCLTAFLPIPQFRSEAATAGKRYSATDYLMRAREYFEKNQIRISDDDPDDPNEVLRVMVETDGKAAVEIAGTAEYTESVQEAEETALHAQEALISRVESLTGNQVLSRSAYLVNAFSIEMTRAQMKEVAAMEGVKAVYPVTSFRQTMHSALDMTSATKLWQQENGGFTGEGIVIAIIDTGINWTHPDMKLDEGVTLKYTKEEMEKKIEELGYGDYYSDKVPFGYCYGGGLHPDINNQGVDHGLHVSGIAAANGDPENGGVVGVAPNAQLLALQTFSDSGQGFNDDMIKAVEDAVKLGADIINMSLGSTAGFYNDVDYLQRALSVAEENGILCCVAAGNDGASSSDGGMATNDWGVVDTGSVSAPATYPGALSVASVENKQVLGHVVSIYAGGEPVALNADMWDFSEGTNINWNDLKDVVIVDCGYGSPEEMSAVAPTLAELDGPWVALIQRGSADPFVTLSFEQKLANTVIAYGAAAALIYNNEPTDETPTALSAGTLNWVRSIMISGNLGLKIRETAMDPAVRFTFEGLTNAWVDSPTGGAMSEFSSWGPTPTLDIKPEISAPGGNIYSISFGTGYATYSGTSMATPYISGASATVLQALKKAVEDGTLVLDEKTPLNLFLKQTLMNTADPILNGHNIYSVRRQGAGMVDPLDAAVNRVLATYEDGLAAITLKEVGKETKFTVTLTNYGTEEAVYVVPTYATVYTDYTDPFSKEYYVVPESDAIVTFDKTEVTVPAGGSAEVTGTLRIGNSVAQNHFVETFIRLDGEIDLTLPLLGFYGDWFEAERIIDPPAWEDENNVLTNYYLFNGTSATTLAGGNSFLGILNGDVAIDPNKIAFSPDGDYLFDTVMPLVGQLRSAETIVVDVLDGDGNVIRQINALEQVAKTLGYDLYQSRQPFTSLTPYLDGPGSWDGTRYDGETGEFVLCDEGQYYVRIRATLPGCDRVEETVMPVKLDLTAPETEILSTTYTDNTLSVTFSTSDFSGVADMFALFINGEQWNLSLQYNTIYDQKTDTYTVTVFTGSYRPGEMNEIALVTMDYAQVEGLATYYTEASYEESPVLFSNISNGNDLSVLVDLTYETLYDMMTLEPSYHNVTAQIRGTADASVESITINGEEAVFDSRHGFRVTVPVELGYGTLKISATDKDGKVVYAAEKRILTDLSAPEVESWVADENGEWDEEMLYSSYFSMQGYVFATRYQKDDMVPVSIEIKDDSLTGVLIRWHEGDLGYRWNELSDYYMWGTVYDPDPVPELLKSVYYTAEEIEAMGGVITVEVPFLSYTGDIFHADGTAEYGTSIYQQVVQCIANDAAGNSTVWNTFLEEDHFAEVNYEMMGDSDVREEDSTSFTGFLWLDPIWDGDLAEGFDVSIVTPDMVDEDGVLHFRGAIGDGSDEMLIDGELIEPTLIDGELIVEFDRKLQPGYNAFWVYFNVYLFGDPNAYITFGSRLVLYYLDDAHPLQVNYGNEAIEEGAVIYTNQDVFTVDGNLLTLCGGVELEINGDQLLFTNPGGLDVEGGRTRPFRYDVALKEGKNVIKVHATDGSSDEYQMTFTVIKDTVAPEKPSVSADDKYLVTATPAGGEKVTLYYSLDGETWTEYTEPFTVTESGTVYVKAVDAAGNESEVAEVAVTVTPSEPSDPTEQPSDPTQKPDEPTEKPDEPTQKPDEPTEQPSEPTEKPDEPTDQPSNPTEKPGEPTDQPSNPTEKPDNPGEEKPPIPPTGDSMAVFAAIAAFAVAVLTAFGFTRKKEIEKV